MPAFLGPLHMSPVDWIARLPRSRLTPISLVKTSLCSYEKAGQPSYRDLGFYDRDLGNWTGNLQMNTLARLPGWLFVSIFYCSELFLLVVEVIIQTYCGLYNRKKKRKTLSRLTSR